jgi:hypothetical protein
MPSFWSAFFILAVDGRVALSGPLLILSLFPAPFLFQRYIARVVAIFGIRAFGPVQLGSQNAPTLTGPLFSALDSYLALRSKVLLIWLAEQANGATSEELKKWTAEASPGEIHSEMTALQATGCVKPDGQKCEVTNLGKRYVNHCLNADGDTKSSVCL